MRLRYCPTSIRHMTEYPAFVFPSFRSFSGFQDGAICGQGTALSASKCGSLHSPVFSGHFRANITSHNIYYVKSLRRIPDCMRVRYVLSMCALWNMTERLSTTSQYLDTRNGLSGSQPLKNGMSVLSRKIGRFPDGSPGARREPPDSGCGTPDNGFRP